MPAHSFMLADLAGSMAGVCLFPLFVLLPGFAIAWLTDLFEFRRRTFAFQLALSVPMSIAICPAVTYLAGRFGSMTAVWALYAASWIFALSVAARRPKSLGPYTRIVVLLAAVWTAIAVFSLIDLEIGARAWYPSAAFDYSLRTGFIQSIAANGIPPSNPFFFPGHAAPLRYHYFWLLLCALVDLAGGSMVSARQAWIAGTAWCGIGMMAVVALYFRLFVYRGAATFRRRAVAGILLLGVTGLDIVPTAALWVLQATGIPAVRPAMEWWNEQVDGFVYTALWESHYLSGLIACLMAFLILWRAPRQWLLAGIALASAAGASIYVAFVFGLFLIAWSGLAMAKRRWSDAVPAIAAGLSGLALALPFAISLRGPALGGPPIELWVRPFSPVTPLFAGRGWLQPLASALALPINYTLELGFFLVAALIWWRRHRKQDRSETAILLTIATSGLICTFFRSSVIGNNDLGWRGFLIAQFGLLLLAVDVIGQPGARRALLTVLLVLGAAGSVYEIAINRFYAPLADAGVVSKFTWLAPDRQAGERNYAYREAGEWIAAATAPSAVVQFNPHVPAQNTSAILYSARRTLAGNETCLSTFGGDPAECSALMAKLDDLAAACRSLPIDLIGADDTDPAWHDPHSWVWTGTPAFANRYVRLFRCR